MPSIYAIPDWAAGTFYKKYAPVRANSLYYYAKSPHTSSASFNLDVLTLWDGVETDTNGDIKPSFPWSPSYSTNITSQPKVKKIQFGDGYAQRIKDGINNNLIILDVLFENRSLDEATAIAHFLYARQGVESFLWEPPAPFNKKKRFICEDSPVSVNFYDNYTVKAKFEEVVI